MFLDSYNQYRLVEVMHQLIIITEVWLPLSIIKAEKLVSSRHVAMAMTVTMLLIQVITIPSLRFIWFSYCWFSKNPKSKQIFLYCGCANHIEYKRMENLLTSRICIKSAVDQMNFKLGMVIIRINSIVQKKFCCYSNMPWGNQFFSLNYAKGL